MDLDTQTHLKTLRDMLAYRQGELRADVHAAQLLRKAKDAATEVTDRKDQAAGWAQSGVDDAALQRDLDELKGVEQALQRLDEGRYGDCVQCGQPIPLQRLLAQPAALRCASCQSVAEHRR